MLFFWDKKLKKLKYDKLFDGHLDNGGHIDFFKVEILLSTPKHTTITNLVLSSLSEHFFHQSAGLYIELRFTPPTFSVLSVVFDRR